MLQPFVETVKAADQAAGSIHRSGGAVRERERERERERKRDRRVVKRTSFCGRIACRSAGPNASDTRCVHVYTARTAGLTARKKLAGDSRVVDTHRKSPVDRRRSSLTRRWRREVNVKWGQGTVEIRPGTPLETRGLVGPEVPSAERPSASAVGSSPA
jgi:hypothetical protein